MPVIRRASPADVAAVAAVVNRAYRTEGGWTTESHLLTAPRIGVDSVAAIIAEPASALVVATDGDDVIGCCQVDRHDTHAYFGMFAVDPSRQGFGAGKALLAAAEEHARASGIAEMRMTVVAQRDELVQWYVRRGYAPSGRTNDFPADHAGSALVAVEELAMIELVKDLA